MTMMIIIHYAGAEAAELQAGSKQRQLEHDEQHHEPASSDYDGDDDDE